MDNQGKRYKNLKVAIHFSIALSLIAAIVVFISVQGIQTGIRQTEFSKYSSETETTITVSNANIKSKTDKLSLWAEDCEAKKALISYVESVTREGSPDYIPEEDRVAVFDMDGTILCETDPYYFDFCLLKYRVLDDPEYKDKASDFEKDVALRIKALMDGDKSSKISMEEHGKAVASAFSGMTIEEFENYIAAFKKQPCPGYNGMTRGEAFYKPMLQVIDYLQENDFKVYIVSGTDRFIVRGIAKDSLNIPRNQLIGSDETLVATNQGDTNGLDYTFTDKDKLVLGGDFIIKNLNMNKVTVIMQEIGIQPVLSFGNSTGDSAMAEYTTTNNKYKSMAFMVCCDDVVRENGNVEKAEKMKELCAGQEWVAISMKSDWSTIYGDGVTVK